MVKRVEGKRGLRNAARVFGAATAFITTGFAGKAPVLRQPGISGGDQPAVSAPLPSEKTSRRQRRASQVQTDRGQASALDRLPGGGDIRVDIGQPGLVQRIPVSRFSLPGKHSSATIVNETVSANIGNEPMRVLSIALSEGRSPNVSREGLLGATESFVKSVQGLVSSASGGLARDVGSEGLLKTAIWYPEQVSASEVAQQVVVNEVMELADSMTKIGRSLSKQGVLNPQIVKKISQFNFSQLGGIGLEGLGEFTKSLRPDEVKALKKVVREFEANMDRGEEVNWEEIAEQINDEVKGENGLNAVLAVVAVTSLIVGGAAVHIVKKKKEKSGALAKKKMRIRQASLTLLNLALLATTCGTPVNVVETQRAIQARLLTSELLMSSEAVLSNPEYADVLAAWEAKLAEKHSSLSGAEISAFGIRTSLNSKPSALFFTARNGDNRALARLPLTGDGKIATNADGYVIEGLSRRDGLGWPGGEAGKTYTMYGVVEQHPGDDEAGPGGPVFTPVVVVADGGYYINVDGQYYFSEEFPGGEGLLGELDENWIAATATVSIVMVDGVPTLMPTLDPTATQEPTATEMSIPAPSETVMERIGAVEQQGEYLVNQDGVNVAVFYEGDWRYLDQAVERVTLADGTVVSIELLDSGRDDKLIPVAVIEGTRFWKWENNRWDSDFSEINYESFSDVIYGTVNEELGAIDTARFPNRHWEGYTLEQDEDERGWFVEQNAWFEQVVGIRSSSSEDKAFYVASFIVYDNQDNPHRLIVPHFVMVDGSLAGSNFVYYPESGDIQFTAGNSNELGGRRQEFTDRFTGQDIVVRLTLLKSGSGARIGVGGVDALTKLLEEGWNGRSAREVLMDVSTGAVIGEDFPVYPYVGFQLHHQAERDISWSVAAGQVAMRARDREEEPVLFQEEALVG